MFELFCPEHGIPAFIMWVVFGCDPSILGLTFQLYCVRFFSLFKLGGK